MPNNPRPRGQIRLCEIMFVDCFCFSHLSHILTHFDCHKYNFSLFNYNPQQTNFSQVLYKFRRLYNEKKNMLGQAVLIAIVLLIKSLANLSCRALIGIERDKKYGLLQSKYYYTSSLGVRELYCHLLKLIKKHRSIALKVCSIETYWEREVGGKKISTF